VEHNADEFKKAWLKCCSEAGITGLHFHDLRHEAGSRMLEAGWPLHHVQAVLGHAEAKTTSGYLNATLQHLLDSMSPAVTRCTTLHKRGNRSLRHLSNSRHRSPLRCW
jgi:integrase